MQTPTWYGPDIVPPKVDGEPRKVLVAHKAPDGAIEMSSGYWLSQTQWIIEGKLQPAQAVRCWTFLPIPPVFTAGDIAIPVDYAEARFTPLESGPKG